MRERLARWLFKGEIAAAYKRGWERGIRSGWDQGAIAEREAIRQGKTLYYDDNPWTGVANDG